MIPLTTDILTSELTQLLGHTSTIQIMLHPGHTHLRGINAHLNTLQHHDDSTTTPTQQQHTHLPPPPL
eukprot:4233922-Prorocentrum_lima.AAC.1